MADGGFDISVLSTYEELLQFQAEWEELYRRSMDATPFLSFDWVSTVIRYLCNDASLRIAVIRYQQEVITIVPFEIKRKKVGPFSLQVLYFFYDEWPLQNSAVFNSRGCTIMPSAVQELIFFLFKTEPEIQFAILTRVPANSQFWEPHVNPSHSISRFQTAKLKIGQTVIISLPASMDEYRRQLSRAHKKTVSRHLNAMEGDFDLNFVRLGLDPSEDYGKVNNLIHDALEVSRKSWQGASIKGRAISDPDTQTFFREVSLKLAQKGMLDLSVLYANRQPVSFIWGTARWPYSTIIKLGFDQAYKQYSPGTVHLFKHIQDSIERRMVAIDFGHEFFEYKSRWSKHFIDLYSVYYFPRRLVPLFLRMGYLTHRKTKSLLRRGAV